MSIRGEIFDSNSRVHGLSSRNPSDGYDDGEGEETRRRQEDASLSLSLSSYGLNSLSLNCKVAFGEFNAGNRDGVSFVSQRSSSNVAKEYRSSMPFDRKRGNSIGSANYRAELDTTF